MAAQQQYWQLEREYYTITTPSNLVVRVVQHSNIISSYFHLHDLATVAAH
jgi:hypothetical protein